MHRTTWRTTARATVPRCAVFGAELAEAAAPAYLPALLERHRAAPRHPRIRCTDDHGRAVDTGRGDAVPMVEGWAADELWAVDVATSCPHCLALEDHHAEHPDALGHDVPAAVLGWCDAAGNRRDSTRYCEAVRWPILWAAASLALDLSALLAQLAADPGHGPDGAGAAPPAERPQLLALTDSTLTAAPPATAMPVPSTRCVVTLAA